MMNRRTFTGLAAVAAAGAGMPAQAIAQTTTLGAPHPPLVAENDPAITVELPQLHRPDGVVNSYVAYPKDIRANTPGIVIAMHIWGVDSQIRDTVRRFAKAGFACIAPDLYSRMNAPSGDGVTNVDEFRPFASRLDRTQYDGDFRAAALYLREKAPSGKLGVAGFCMGGHLTLIQAIDNADHFAGAAPFYGAVKDIDPSKVHIPICGSYGEKDMSIPADDVRAWSDALRVKHDIREYPTAGHAFFDDTRKSYVSAAAQDAWERTITFFTEQLGLQSS